MNDESETVYCANDPCESEAMFRTPVGTPLCACCGEAWKWGRADLAAAVHVAIGRWESGDFTAAMREELMARVGQRLALLGVDAAVGREALTSTWAEQEPCGCCSTCSCGAIDEDWQKGEEIATGQEAKG